MPGTDLVQAVLRALDVVDTVARSQNGLSVREIAEELGLKRPTVNNLLRTLAERRYVELREKPRRYVLGIAVNELANLSSSHSLHHAAVAIMREIQQAVPRVNIIFAEPVHDELQATLRMDRDRPGVVQRPRHEQLHPYGKATSLTWQAFGGESRRAAIHKRFPFEEYGAHIWKTEDRLNDFLNNALQKGYAVSPLNQSGGYLSVAAPVYDVGNQFIAVFGAFISPAANYDFDALTQIVVDAAARLSNLG